MGLENWILKIPSSLLDPTFRIFPTNYLIKRLKVRLLYFPYRYTSFQVSIYSRMNVELKSGIRLKWKMNRKFARQS